MCFWAKRFLWVPLLLAISSPAVAQTADELFDDSVLQEIRLTVSPDDWNQFKINYMASTYYSADISWRGIEVQNIGIRHRGTGSRSGTKPYLGLKFDQYTKGQQFLGLSSLRLKNVIQDPSFLHDRLSMLLFRQRGIPAPREAYARLYVNDEYRGLYLIIEEVDNKFLDRVFGEHGGCLYSYNWVGEYHFEYLGDDPALYAPDRFEPKSCQSETDPAALVEMIRTVNQASDENFPGEVSEFLDLGSFLNYVAVESFLAEWDGFLGHLGMNNFYLYRLEGTKRFQFIPWDKEQGFGDPQHSIWHQVDLNVLTLRALSYPELYDGYLDALRRTALEAGGTGGWLDNVLEWFYAQIRLAALEDPFKPASNEEFENAVNATREYIRQRYDFVLSQVGPQRSPGVFTSGL